MKKITTAGFTNETKRGRGPWFPSEQACSDELKHFIGLLLVQDSYDRYTLQDCFEHPLRDYQKTADVENDILRYLVDFHRDFSNSEDGRKLLRAIVKDFVDANEKFMWTFSFKRILNRNEDFLGCNSDSTKFDPEVIKSKLIQMGIEEEKANGILETLAEECDGSLMELCTCQIACKINHHIQKLQAEFEALEQEAGTNTGKVKQEDYMKVLKKYVGTSIEEDEIELIGLKYCDVDEETGDPYVDYTEIVRLFFRTDKPDKPEPAEEVLEEDLEVTENPESELPAED